MVALRATIPDWVSMVVGNTIVLIGPVVLYLGLLRFCSKKASSLLISFIVAVLATFVRGGQTGGAQATHHLRAADGSSS